MRRYLDRHMYEALGVKDVNSLLPPPAPMQPMDPASENIMALNGKKFQAFPKTEPPSTHGCTYSVHGNDDGA